jgi:hypothetical protein
MKVHRFVSIGELRELHVSGKVAPLSPSDRLYFFEDDEWHDPQMQLEYLNGIIAECSYTRNERNGKQTEYFHICLHLEIPGSKLKKELRLYADPDGEWYDRMAVTELHLFEPYHIDNVEYVEFVVDERCSTWNFPNEERYVEKVSEALSIIDQKSVIPYETIWERIMRK